MQLLFFSIIFFSCGAQNSGTKKTEDKPLSLESRLNTIGNVVDLPTSGSDNKIQGGVVDSDLDGIAEGIDLNGDNEANVLYGTLEGGLSTKASLAKEATAFAFYIPGDNPVQYFFLLVEATDLVMSNTAEPDSSDTGPTTSVITFVVVGGSLAGLDTSGDGQADDDSLENIKLGTFVSGFTGSCTLDFINPLTSNKMHLCYQSASGINTTDDLKLLCNIEAGATTITGDFSLKNECSLKKTWGYCAVSNFNDDGKEIKMNLYLYQNAGLDTIEKAAQFCFTEGAVYVPSL